MYDPNAGWITTPDYSRQYRPTIDPRVFEVIELDTDPAATALNGDAYAPAAWAEYRGYGWTLTRAGYTYDDDDALRAVELAWNTWGQSSDTAARYLRIFAEVRQVEELRDSSGALLLILDTDAHRLEMGTPDTVSSSDYLAGDEQAWRAYLDGDVWGVGHAINPARVIDDAEPVDLDDGSWDIEIESWGYYGEDWARSAVSEFEMPALPTMLDIPQAS